MKFALLQQEALAVSQQRHHPLLSRGTSTLSCPFPLTKPVDPLMRVAGLERQIGRDEAVGHVRRRKGRRLYLVAPCKIDRDRRDRNIQVAVVVVEEQRDAQRAAVRDAQPCELRGHRCRVARKVIIRHIVERPTLPQLSDHGAVERVDEDSTSRARLNCLAWTRRVPGRISEGEAHARKQMAVAVDRVRVERHASRVWFARAEVLRAPLTAAHDVGSVDENPIRFRAARHRGTVSIVLDCRWHWRGTKRRQRREEHRATVHSGEDDGAVECMEDPQVAVGDFFTWTQIDVTVNFRREFVAALQKRRRHLG